jgi:drug/metabolite transporter (DMT)-like permease
MSEGGRLDLRYPIGGLFLVLGLILVAYGAATGDNAEMYARATGVNVNLWWGVVMLAFGAFMWGMAMRAGRRDAGERTDVGTGSDHS